MNFNGRKGCVPTSMQLLMCVQLEAASIGFSVTAKTCPKRPLKIRPQQKTIFVTNNSLMKVKSIAEYNTFDLN